MASSISGMLSSTEPGNAIASVLASSSTPLNRVRKPIVNMEFLI